MEQHISQTHERDSLVVTCILAVALVAVRLIFDGPVERWLIFAIVFGLLGLTMNIDCKRIDGSVNVCLIVAKYMTAGVMLRVLADLFIKDLF